MIYHRYISQTCKMNMSTMRMRWMAGLLLHLVYELVGLLFLGQPSWRSPKESPLVDHVISAEDFEKLNDRIKHYMDWSLGPL
jgi:hypothetical protein